MSTLNGLILAKDTRLKKKSARMHSSRTRTGCFSCRLGPGWVSTSVSGGCPSLGPGCHSGSKGGVYHTPLDTHHPSFIITPLMDRMTDRCKNITLPRTWFAGGNDTPISCCMENKHTHINVQVDYD